MIDVISYAFHPFRRGKAETGFVTLRAAHAKRGCHRPSGGGNLAPRGERLGPEFAKGAAGDQMALNVEVVVDGGMRG
jgi:hypothetical protein